MRHIVIREQNEQFGAMRRVLRFGKQYRRFAMTEFSNIPLPMALKFTLKDFDKQNEVDMERLKINF